jgi:putative membrane protein
MNLRNLAASALAVCAAALTGAPALAQTALPTPQFISTAAASDKFERQAGRLAETHAGSGRVKAFGARMVHDHTLTTRGLKRAIKTAGLPPPPPPVLSADQSMMISDLQSKHGHAFDVAYVQDQVMAHQQAVSAFQGYAMGGDNPVIRQAAQKTLPLIQHHLMMAQAIQSSMH